MRWVTLATYVLVVMLVASHSLCGMTCAAAPCHDSAKTPPCHQRPSADGCQQTMPAADLVAAIHLDPDLPVASLTVAVPAPENRQPEAAARFEAPRPSIPISVLRI
jgi:hypothetical protein